MKLKKGDRLKGHGGIITIVKEQNWRLFVVINLDGKLSQVSRAYLESGFIKEEEKGA